MRIQKYLSQKRILSRRETEKYIKKGLIMCNGKVVKELGFKVDPDKDKIEILPLANKIERKITIAINKPRGIVSSKNESEGTTVFNLFPQFKNLNTVGRLDKESEGLLLLSNDGVITSAITGADHKIEKEYEIFVQENINPGKIKKLETGIMIEGGPTLPAKTELINRNSFKIILKEGRKHQIRRMADAINLTITNLKRIRIGNIFLNNIPLGGYRELSKLEIEKLKKLAK